MYLSGVGVQAEDVSRLAERHGWAVEDTPSAPRIVVLAEDHFDTFAEWLRPPTIALIERRIESVAPMTANLSISVRTDSAWTVNLAGMICDEMESRGWIPDDMAFRLRTAVYEALANAIVHGNLSVAGVPDMDLEAFSQMNAVLETRLAEEGYAGRPLLVEVTADERATVVAVEDAGDGFEIESDMADSASETIEPRGRHGLGLIQTCASALVLEKGGRRLVMRFDRDAE